MTAVLDAALSALVVPRVEALPEKRRPIPKVN